MYFYFPSYDDFIFNNSKTNKEGQFYHYHRHSHLHKIAIRPVEKLTGVTVGEFENWTYLTKDVAVATPPPAVHYKSGGGWWMTIILVAVAAVSLAGLYQLFCARKYRIEDHQAELLQYQYI